MFKDYYSILDIPFESSDKEIKDAYKKQAFRWHPDKNARKDAVRKMQEINEAYLILKDQEAKMRYDQEYKKYYSSRKSNFSSENHRQHAKESTGYVFSDEILERWVSNARKQAHELVSQTFKEFKIGVKAAGNEMAHQLVIYISIGVIFSAILALSRGCS